MQKFPTRSLFVKSLMNRYKSENYVSKKNNKCDIKYYNLYKQLQCPAKSLYWNNHDVNVSRLKCIQICEDDEWYIGLGSSSYKNISGATLALIRKRMQ